MAASLGEEKFAMTRTSSPAREGACAPQIGTFACRLLYEFMIQSTRTYRKTGALLLREH